jgi:hypothetical protein
MILLNQPYSLYERQLDQARRHLAARRALICALYCAGCLAVGIALGMLATH